MFTVLTNNRNSNLFLLIAVAIALVVIVTLAGVPSLAAPQPAIVPAIGEQAAHDLFRQGELVLYDRSVPASIGGPAFYEYRMGEWSVGAVDTIGDFRQEELSLYGRPATSIGGPAYYEYRQGEWFGN